MAELALEGKPEARRGREQEQRRVVKSFEVMRKEYLAKCFGTRFVEYVEKFFFSKDEVFKSDLEML